MTLEEKARDIVATVGLVPGNVVEAGISEIQNVLDAIKTEVDKAAPLAPKAFDSAEEVADATLNNIKSHVSAGLTILTEFLHLSKNPPTPPSGGTPPAA